MAAAQNLQNFFTQARNKNRIIVTDPPKFDLESYVQNYKGRTRFERLLLIGTSSTFLCVEALKAAVIEAKNGKDLQRYSDALGCIKLAAPEEPEATRDQVWIDNIDKLNQAETHRLEAELKGYKNNLIKESIRMGNEDLGKHYQNIGDLPKAFEAYGHMRQDVSIAKHIVDVSKHIIDVAIEQRNWISVTSNVQKIKGVSLHPEEEKVIQPYLTISTGLAHMAAGEYYAAANSFLDTDARMGSSCNTILSPNDVAIYGGLCALASMERNEMHAKVLENSNFRTYLELEPHVRRAITFFVNSRYSACLSILEAYRVDYLLDIHLQKHVDNLYHLVRSKSIVQYFIPFSCVTLDSLNSAFAAPGKSIEKELVNMIQRGELQARIDTQNRLLTSLPSIPRSALQSQTLKIAKGYEREACRRIQRMNIAGAELEVKGPKKPGGQLGSMDDLFGGGASMMPSGREERSMRSFHQGFE
jgi:COP9 signalosome complex subunit 1